MAKIYWNSRPIINIYKWLPESKRFYFSTQADTNGDRVIDENDKYFYYFIDFAKNAQIVTAYDFSKPKA